MKTWIAFFIGLMLIAALAEAAPVLTGAAPAGNSFIKGAVNFSVNVSGAGTDTGSVRLYIISEEARSQNEDWDSYALPCAQHAQNSWACSMTLSFSIVGSNTVELFYFEASDTSGGKTTLGSKTSPLTTTLDRIMPSMYFSAPQNNAYVSGNATLRVSVSDPLSGIDESSVEFYIGNQWTSAANNEATVNTLNYADGAQVTVLARANDKAGNKVNASVTFITDNEAPAITVASPQNNAYMSGYQTFAVSATDNIAGINAGKVRMRLGSLDYTLICSGSRQYDCSVIVDTTLYSNSQHNATITATDAAGNSRTASVMVNINNTQQQAPPPATKPTIKIGLSQNEYVRGVKVITAAVSNPLGAVTGVTLSFKGQGMQMACSQDFSSCSYSLDTRSYPDGAYTFSATANNNAGYTVTDSAAAYIDNTPPTAKITAPNITKGTVPVSIAITDENPKAAGIVFKTGSAEKALSCSVNGKTASCAYQLDTTALADGLNTIGVAGSDGTGNLFSSYTNIYVDNNAPVFRFLKISPIELSSPGPIEFSAGLNDTGTGVRSARVIIRSAEFTGSLDLVRTSDVWYGKGVLVSYGTHNVDIETSDESGNTAQLKDKGQFFVGNLSCGDGICRPEENYCNCPADCQRPSCASNYAVDCSSGVATCSSQQRCGDNVCSSNETCASCSADCGSCTGILEIVKSKTNKDNSLPVISNATPAAQAAEPITIIKKGPTETEYVFVDAIQTNTLITILIIVLIVVVAIAIIIKKRPKKSYESFLTPSNPEKY